MIRGVRGATTVVENNAEEILIATDQLIREMIEKNTIKASDVAQVLISVTDDIDAVFPAAALRKIEGWSFVPVMCMQEIPVMNSLKKCIRVMMTVNTAIDQEEIKHIYLGEAVSLRPDLKV
ncbi:chorismate mutase [Bacillus sp. PS06]|uniref:chorismate mutase n=1 Tax=Bacillus sp. PS06 TaxID=2764176 RepID=UPI0017849539|nr:chorismate mutase [Bacillus sp. PS06]MBD8070249.1 chorismate mutase [Bacillus sp. PS06]